MTLWPDRPMFEGPATKTGDSFIVVRVDSEMAKWLAAKTPGDPLLTNAVDMVLREAKLRSEPTP